VLEASELLKRARQGESDAFAELVRRYRGVVFSVRFEYTRNFASSEDLIQEVFLAAHRSLSSLKDPDKLVPWLGGIARNVSRMHLRGLRREASQVDGRTLSRHASPDRAQPSLRGPLTQVAYISWLGAPQNASKA